MGVLDWRLKIPRKFRRMNTIQCQMPVEKKATLESNIKIPICYQSDALVVKSYIPAQMCNDFFMRFSTMDHGMLNFNADKKKSQKINWNVKTSEVIRSRMWIIDRLERKLFLPHLTYCSLNTLTLPLEPQLYSYLYIPIVCLQLLLTKILFLDFSQKN